MEVTFIFIWFFIYAKEAFSALGTHAPHAAHMALTATDWWICKMWLQSPKCSWQLWAFQVSLRDKLVAALALKLSQWVKHFSPRKAHWEDSKLHATVTQLALGQVLPCSPEVGGTCTWALAALPQPAIPLAITSLLCGALVFDTAGQDRKCNCLPVIHHVLFPTLSKSPTPFSSQGKLLVPVQDPGKWSPFKSCFQEQRAAQLAAHPQTQAEYVLKTVLHF